MRFIRNKRSRSRWIRFKNSNNTFWQRCFSDNNSHFWLFFDQDWSKILMKEQWKLSIYKPILAVLGHISRKIDKISWWGSSKNYRFILNFDTFSLISRGLNPAGAIFQTMTFDLRLIQKVKWYLKLAKIGLKWPKSRLILVKPDFGHF